VKRTQIHLVNGLIGSLEQEADRHYPNETGGVLLGFADAQKDDQIQIALQVGPGPKAVHKRFRFEPDSNWQQKRIAEAYEKSCRIVSYLGDWHSHPRGGAVPSSIDRATAKEISHFKEARLPHPLILILYGEPKEWKLAAYRRQWWKLRDVDIFSQE
jgi:integrative and conjugative element protein (TIGR02256 family)